MKLAINQATTMSASFEEDVVAYSAAGFNAVELWLDKVTTFLENHPLRDARKLLTDHGLKPIGACFHFGVMLSEGVEREKNLEEFRRKLEICQALGVPVLVIPTDFPDRDVGPNDYDRAAEGLAEAAQLAAPYHVALAVEFIKGAKLIGTLGTAMTLVRKTEQRNVGIALDTFHLYAGASKTEQIGELTKEELLLVHLNDLPPMPVEIAEDRDRIFPGQGVLPLEEILRAVSKTGYDGHYSLELFNDALCQGGIGNAARLACQNLRGFLDSIGSSEE